MRALLAAFVVTVLVASACGSSEAPGTQQIVGVMISIDSGSGFGDVEGFTIKEKTKSSRSSSIPMQPTPSRSPTSIRTALEPSRCEWKLRPEMGN